MKNQKQYAIVVAVLLISGAFSTYAMAPQYNYHSAGILPYAIDSNKTKWVLAGIEPFRGNQAFDFGGKKDPEDHNNARYTAAREGTEELLFLFDDAPNFNRIVGIHAKYPRNFELHKANSSTYNFLRETMKKSPSSLARGYITFFVKIDYDPSIPQNFVNRRKSQRLPGSWIEKNQLMWLPLNQIIDALQKNPDDNTVYVQGTKLFPHFAQSLRTALKNGTLAQLQ